MSESDTVKSIHKVKNDKFNNKMNKMSEEEINKVLQECGNDQQKMLSLCKDLLKNSSNQDVKSVLSR